VSYESSLASGWERYSEDAYEGDVDVEDPCVDCDAQPPKGMMAVGEFEASEGWARWTCLECGAENSIHLNYGYRDIAEDKYYDL
jgi:hypothetical protein